MAYSMKQKYPVQQPSGPLFKLRAAQVCGRGVVGTITTRIDHMCTYIVHLSLVLHSYVILADQVLTYCIQGRIQKFEREGSNCA